jgi:hypothetical protein
MPRRRACAHNRSCAGSDRRLEFLAETAIVVDGPPHGTVLKFREGGRPNKDLKRAPSRHVRRASQDQNEGSRSPYGSALTAPSNTVGTSTRQPPAGRSPSLVTASVSARASSRHRSAAANPRRRSARRLLLRAESAVRPRFEGARLSRDGTCRALWDQPGEAITPRGHLLLWVDVEGQPYEADVGFGRHADRVRAP